MAKFRRIGTTALQYGDPRVRDREAREREAVLNYIKMAGNLSIDILLFQEEFGFVCFNTHLIEGRKQFAPADLRIDLPSYLKEPGETAISLDDCYIQHVREAARAAGVNVVLPILERSGNRIYNSLVPVTSEGLLLKPYRKMYPVIGEMDNGISPGIDNPAQILAGIPVGFSICFDINFDEVYELARASEAKLMLWSSMWMGGHWLKARSARYGFYTVSATPDGCSFVDMDGTSIVESYTSYPQTYGENNLVFEDLNFDREVFHCAADGKLNEIRNRYGSRIHIRNRPQDCFCIIETLDATLSIEEVKDEFKLTNYYDYLKCCKAVRDTALSQGIAGSVDRG